MSNRRRQRLLGAMLAPLVATGLVSGVPQASARPASPPAAAAPSAAADTTIRLDGRGFGHGVGMSQYGAYGMASRGLSAPQITGYYYQGTNVADRPQPGGIRVLVATAGSTVVTGTSGPVGFWVNGTNVAQSAPGQPVTISSQGSSTVLDGRVQPAGTMIIDPYGNPMNVSASGHQYRWGRLYAHPTGGGALRLVVGDLTMQQYLRGLGEVPSSWPTEALRAQAIAGRTYAKQKTDARRAADPGRIYDLDGSTLDQAYVGYFKEVGPSGDRWVAAVDATADDTVLYNGATAETYYSSSSGGHTESSGYSTSFGTQLPYLHGVPDPDDLNSANPNRSWTRSYSGTAMGTWVQADRGVNIGMVQALQISGSIGASGRTDRASVRLIGTGGSHTMTGSQFRAMVNKHSTDLPSSLYVLNPVGNVDGLTAGVGGARLYGWAIDPSTTDPIDVHVYVDGGWGGAYRADVPRPDVGAAYPGSGSDHGFDINLALPVGTHQVCTWAINVGTGDAHPLLGCRSINVTADPIGNLDGAVPVAGGVRAYGWALDPDTTAAVHVNITVDGALAASVPADLQREDVASAYPPWGAARGFLVDVPVAAGSHRVCATAGNLGRGSVNTLLGCRTLTIPGAPFGSLDGLRSTPPPAVLRGWTIDPQTAGPIWVHFYVNGGWGGARLADVERPDVGSAYPSYGSRHGYEIPVTPGSGRHCVYAIDPSGQGPNVLLGCVDV